MSERLESLDAGQRIVFGGDRVAVVDEHLAASFRYGDRLVVVQTTGALLHIAAADTALVDRAVTAATEAFAVLANCSDDAITRFFELFACRLEDDDVFEPIARANELDVAAAHASGRATTRLTLSASMRDDMVSGLRTWRDAGIGRSEPVGTIEHVGWSVEIRRAPLGVVGFVFEGRPNVFADACGVVRSGNTVVFRIGSDALRTARAIVAQALAPALRGADLPVGTVQLVDAESRASGHALFADPRLALAVARGSGSAVAELGAVAAQAGTPVSLHGTGGAWLIAGDAASTDAFARAVGHSLDRKVCNTLNVCALPSARAAELVPVLLQGLDPDTTIHVAEGSQPWFVGGSDHRLSVLSIDELGTEWEWEHTPELSVVVTDDVDHAVLLANRHSPQFVVSVVTDDGDELERCYAALDAPFVGNGFTRWVDGQYALDQPELGLSNWQSGRQLGRGAILSGDSVHTLRYLARVTDHDTHR